MCYLERFRRVCSTLLGILVGLLVIGTLGEVYLRNFPPQDIQPYLGELSPGRDVFKSDPQLGIDYLDFASFEEANRAELQRYTPFSDCQPEWALFGNSFVQMDGMLGDSAAAAMPDKTYFYLGKNEWLPIRVAQVRLLLNSGLCPKRIVFALMPLDSTPLAQHPLETIRANSNGVITYQAPTWTDVTRLGLASWLRFSNPVPKPNSYARKLTVQVPQELATQYESIFDVLASESSRSGVKVTILLIPTYEQITRGQGFAFQDLITELAVSRSMDVCDVRNSFADEAEKSTLFIPDHHFSTRGNAILLSSLLRHVGAETER